MLERSGSPDVFYWGFLLGFMGVYRVYFGDCLFIDNQLFA
jgi:hypothetical protein